jgi:hypothetical protein
LSFGLFICLFAKISSIQYYGFSALLATVLSNSSKMSS